MNDVIDDPHFYSMEGRVSVSNSNSNSMENFENGECNRKMRAKKIEERQRKKYNRALKQLTSAEELSRRLINCCDMIV